MEETKFQSEISFSENFSNKRIQSACRLIGSKTVNRIIGLALFLLGGNREKICAFLNIPIGTFFSFLTRFQREGVKALEDQRESFDKPTFSKVKLQNLELIFGECKVIVSDLTEKNQLVVTPSNSIQFKTLVLSFMSSGLLNTKEASEALGITERHVRDLCENLRNNDVNVLLDKRQGQQKEYAFTEKIKAEIIQQFVVNLVSHKPTASRYITEQVNETCHSSLSERAMRQHLTKLGLKKIKKSLPKLLKGVKKSLKP